MFHLIEQLNTFYVMLEFKYYYISILVIHIHRY